MVALPTALAMLGPVLVRRCVHLVVAGFKFAAVAVLYAVLLAFAVIAVDDHHTEADRYGDAIGEGAQAIR